MHEIKHIKSHRRTYIKLYQIKHKTNKTSRKHRNLFQ